MGFHYGIVWTSAQTLTWQPPKKHLWDFFPTDLRHRSHRNKNDIFIHVGFNFLKELSDKGIPSPVERAGEVSHGEFPETERYKKVVKEQGVTC